MSASPWMKFYPQDWRSDEKLRVCSLAARGLWIEMLAIMHRSERYGQLLVNGNVPTREQLAVLVGASPSEVTALLAELDGAGVFSSTSSGILYSRRMTRDEKKAKKARQNGKSGGNPSLRKQRGNSASDNPPDNHTVKGRDKPQKPEARSQKEQQTSPPRSAARDAVMEAAGFVTDPSDWSLLDDWRAAGADLQTQILPVLRQVRGQLMARSGKNPFMLKFFDLAVRAKIAEDAAESKRLKGIAKRIREQDERQAREDAAEAKRLAEKGLSVGQGATA